MKSIQKRLAALALAVCLSLSLVPAAFAAGDFTDVPADHWAYADIMACAEAGTVTGFADGSFHPNDEVTGVQFIAMLTRTFYNDLVEAAKETETSSWYAPHVAAAENADILHKVTVEDKAMNRFHMAAALYNILEKENKLNNATTAKLQGVKTALKDYNNLKYNGSSYLAQVKYCYALGVITGMPDGAFHGEQTMTRAQACTVVMRMVRLINGETLPTQTAQPETTERLTNGKEITVENVQELLEQIKQEYPQGTPWDENSSYKNASKNTANAFTLAFKGETSGGSVQYGCGGFAALVSQYIFGDNATRRAVTDITEVRPGDIVVKYNASGKTMHMAIVNYVIAPNTGDNHNPDMYDVYLVDGNRNDQISYEGNYGVRGCGKENASKNGEYYKFVTRYPD